MFGRKRIQYLHDVIQKLSNRITELQHDVDQLFFTKNNPPKYKIGDTIEGHKNTVVYDVKILKPYFGCFYYEYYYVNTKTKEKGIY